MGKWMISYSEAARGSGGATSWQPPCAGSRTQASGACTRTPCGRPRLRSRGRPPSLACPCPFPSTFLLQRCMSAQVLSLAACMALRQALTIAADPGGHKKSCQANCSSDIAYKSCAAAVASESCQNLAELSICAEYDNEDVLYGKRMRRQAGLLIRGCAPRQPFS